MNKGVHHRPVIWRVMNAFLLQAQGGFLREGPAQSAIVKRNL